MNRNDRPIIVGLDIGTTKVVAIAGRKNEFGKLEILGFGRADSEGVTHGVVMNIEQCVQSVELAMKRCLENNPRLQINEVYVGIAGRHIKSVQLQGSRVRSNVDSEISKEDVEKLLQDQRRSFLPSGDQIIDIIAQDYAVDNIANIKDPVGMSGVKISANFHVITGDTNAIRNIKRCVDRSGLRTCDIMLQPLASAAAVISNEDMEAGVAIVDIGGGTTDIAIFADSILRHTAVIPYAGVNITNDIQTGLRVLKSQAEQMKVQFGAAHVSGAPANSYITIPGLRGLPSKEVTIVNLAHIIQARMEEILEYVMFHIRQVGLEHKLNGGIILTGGGARLKHITQLTELVTGLEARIGYPNEHLAGGYNEALMSPMYSTCIGLILRGYDDYESGSKEFAGEVANYLRDSDEVNNVQAMAVVQPAEEPVAVAAGAAAAAAQADSTEKANRKQDNMRQLFARLRGKFLDLFEDFDEDKPLE